MTHSSPTRSSSHRELPGPTPDEAEAGILPFVVRICTCETQRAVFAECQHARLQLHGIAQGGDHSRADRPAVKTCPHARRNALIFGCGMETPAAIPSAAHHRKPAAQVRCQRSADLAFAPLV